MGSEQPSLDKFLEFGGKARGIQDTVMIIVDFRESNSSAVAELSKLNVDIELAVLPCGDYILSGRVGIERKTIHDFASSIIDGRLFEQASTLKESFERPIMVIEGLGLPVRGVRPEALMGALGCLLIDYGLPTIWTRDPHETALLFATIARREQIGGRKTPKIRGKKKPPSLKDLQEYIVAGLPNVDVTLSKRLLRRFKTVESVFKASTKELKMVEGIGAKKSKHVRDTLTSEYKGEC